MTEGAIDQHKSVFERIAASLPNDATRARFMAHLTSLRGLNEKDEIFALLETCGFLTLVANEIPGRIEEQLRRLEEHEKALGMERERVKSLIEGGKSEFRDLYRDFTNELSQSTDLWIEHRNSLKAAQKEILQGIKATWELSERQHSFLEKLGKLWIKEAAIVAALAFFLGVMTGHFLHLIH